MILPLHPKFDKPWQFGILQCSHARIWTVEEERLFLEIARRLEDGLSSLLMYRDLKASEEKYRDLIENEKDIIYTLDVKGNITFSSPAVEKILGYRPEEVEGKKFMLLIHEEWKEKALKDFSDTIETGEIISETVLLDKKGRPHFVEYSSTTIKDGNTVIGTRGIARDITERKKAEEALRKSEEHYRMLAEKMNDGLSQIDENGNYVYVNERYGQILDYSPEEMIGRHWSEFYDKNTQKIMNDQLVLRKEGIVEPYELMTTTRDGRNIYLRVSPQSIFDEDGMYRGSISLKTDITEHKKAQKELADTREQLQFAIDGSGVGLWDWYVQTGKAIFNEKWANIIGYTLEEIQPVSIDTWIKYAHPEDMKKSNAVLELHFQGKTETYECETRMKHKLGHWIWVLDRGKVVEWDTDGKPLRMTGTHLDITERKRAEEQIEKLAKFPSENPNPVLRLSGDGTIIFCNSAGFVLLKTLKRQVGESLPKPFAKRVKEALISGDISTFEFKCYSGCMLELTLAPISDMGYVNVYGLDITARKQTEKNLLKYQQQLKSLASQLTLTEERERRRIAVGLHDQICQSLAISKIKIEGLLHSGISKDRYNILKNIRDWLNKVISDTRSLTFDLSSPILYELGFEKAVAAWLEEEIQRKHNIITEFRDDGKSKPLGENLRMFLFRDVRELLINVVKHAHANKVTVSVNKVGSTIRITVEDDGIGFEHSRASSASSTGFGLFSIRERLEHLGGEFNIESSPGHGSKITLLAPIDQVEKNKTGDKK
jgi:PAS domain S-box-containing protein